MRAVDAVMECLKAEGVDVVFGLPGGANLPTYDAFYDAGIRHVLVRHEAGGGHAAEGYAKATGKVGVSLATSGPGATNLVTPIADAMMDSVPVVFITGQVRTELLGTDGFQEADTMGITMPIVKHSFMIQHPLEIPRAIHEAFHIARTGRPGVVLIDIPRDVQQQLATESAEPIRRQRPHRAPEQPAQAQIAQAAGFLAAAERPMILAGRGVAIAAGQGALRELAEICDAPVGTTLLGTGVFPSTHPLALGLVGFMGTGYCNQAVTDCDVLLMVGMRADDRVTCRLDQFAPRARHIIHINIDPAELGKTVKADCQVVGDACTVLAELAVQIPTRQRPAWRAQVALWRELHPLRYPSNGLLQPQEVLAACYARLGPGDITVADVGLNQIWAAVAWAGAEPGKFLNSGGQGTMGYALPAAIGAQAAHPERTVLSVSGEGGFVMTLQELATAVEARLPVKAVVLNNRHLGMVRQFQDDFYGGVRSQVDHHLTPDFVLLAKAFGCFGAVVEQVAEIGPALDAAFAHQGPAVVDFRIDPGANVYPIVPLGLGLPDFIEYSQA